MPQEVDPFIIKGWAFYCQFFWPKWILKSVCLLPERPVLLRHTAQPFMPNGGAKRLSLLHKRSNRVGYTRQPIGAHVWVVSSWNTFSRLLKHKHLYISQEYTRARRSNSSYITYQYNDNNQIGSVLNFFQHYAIVKTHRQETAFVTQLDEQNIRHISQVTDENVIT